MMNTLTLYDLETVVTGLTGAEFVIRSAPKSGAYAQVYEVESRSDGERYILKLNSSAENHRNEMDILRRVSMALGDDQLTGSSVPLIDEISGAPEGWFGHVEGMAAGKCIADLDLEEEQQLEIVLNFAKILRSCAGHRIAYLDVKPLNHVFWDEVSKTVTVIDWNVAQSETSVPVLRKDILEFCRRLPEFFTKKLEDSRDALHPLSWNFGNKQLSYNVWALLADISFALSASLVPDTPVLSLPLNKLDFKTKDQQLEDLLATWSALIERIEFSLNLAKLGVPDPVWFTRVVDTDVSDARLEDILQTSSIDQEHVDRLVQHVSDYIASEASSIRRDLPVIETKLHLWRWLAPRDSRVYLISILYSLWSRLPRLGDDWKRLITNIMIGSGDAAKDVFELLQHRQQNLIEEIKNFCELMGEEVYGIVLTSAFTDKIAPEIEIWSKLEMVRARPEDEKYRAVTDLFVQYPTHPLINEEKIRIEETIQSTRQKDQLLAELQRQYRDGEWEKCLETIQSLGAFSDDAEVKAFIDQHQAEILFILRLRKEMTFWDLQMLESLLDDIHVNPVYSQWVASEIKSKLQNRIRIIKTSDKSRKNLEVLKRWVDELHNEEEASTIAQSLEEEIQSLDALEEHTPEFGNALDQCIEILHGLWDSLSKSIREIRNIPDRELDVYRDKKRSYLDLSGRLSAIDRILQKYHAEDQGAEIIKTTPDQVNIVFVDLDKRREELLTNYVAKIDSAEDLSKFDQNEFNLIPPDMARELKEYLFSRAIRWIQQLIQDGKLDYAESFLAGLEKQGTGEGGVSVSESDKLRREIAFKRDAQLLNAVASFYSNPSRLDEMSMRYEGKEDVRNALYVISTAVQNEKKTGALEEKVDKALTNLSMMRDLGARAPGEFGNRIDSAKQQVLGDLSSIKQRLDSKPINNNEGGGHSRALILISILSVFLVILLVFNSLFLFSIKRNEQDVNKRLETMTNLQMQIVALASTSAATDPQEISQAPTEALTEVPSDESTVEVTPAPASETPTVTAEPTLAQTAENTPEYETGAGASPAIGSTVNIGPLNHQGAPMQLYFLSMSLDPEVIDPDVYKPFLVFINTPGKENNSVTATITKTGKQKIKGKEVGVLQVTLKFWMQTAELQRWNGGYKIMLCKDSDVSDIYGDYVALTAGSGVNFPKTDLEIIGNFQQIELKAWIYADDLP